MTSSEAPGRLLGAGRDADVYAIGHDRVLRRYRIPLDVTAEARIMQYLDAAGFPVPKVYDAAGSDLVMERLDGPDMLADLARRPWTIPRHAKTLADLHNRLHAIAAPPDWPSAIAPDGTVLFPGNAVMHMDLHPANVMLSQRGPVVIDWTAARAGLAGADVALAYLIIATGETDLLPTPARVVVGVLRRRLLRHFVAAVDDNPWPHIPLAARIRMANKNTRPAEAARLLRICEQVEQAPGRRGRVQ
jgi:aminoglycoside phosphotransferase (APT) family kinase protein